MSLAGAALALLLLMQHHGEPAVARVVEEACGAGPDSGCAAVARSSYSRFVGLPLAAWGLLFSLGIAALLGLGLAAGEPAAGQAARLSFYALAAALAVDVVLLGLQALAIGAYCVLCLFTYVVNAATLVALLPARRLAAASGAVRPLLPGFSVGALGVAAAVVLADSTLALRERQRAGAVLGPAPAAVTAPTTDLLATAASPAAANGDEIARLREEARLAVERAGQLQATLDDPQKLESYFADKAAREYEQGAVHALRLEGFPLKGPAQAAVKVVEFSDFLCPFCRNVAGAFAGYLPQTRGQVAVYFKNYPLDPECNINVRQAGHPGACLLAQGGLCAQEQGKFWAYHDRVFDQELSAVQPRDVARIAAEAGLDGAAFEACFNAPRTRERLKAEIAEGQRVGVQATPTLYINGRKLPRLNDFTATVDKELRKKGLPTVTPAH
jgi:protein-disulfide isomerase/uncharacterized membrane protein